MPQFWKFRIFFCLRPFNNADCTGFQQGVDVADTVNAIDRCCANVKRAEGEVVQPRPRPGGVVLTVGGLPLRRLLPLFFPSKYPPPLTQFQVLFTQVLAFVLPTCWVQYSKQASTSPSLTLLYTRVCPPSILTLLASDSTFSAAVVYQQRLPRENI